MSAAPVDGRTAATRAIVNEWISLETLPDPTPLFGVLENLEPIVRGGALLHLARSLIEDRGIDAALGYVRTVDSSSGLRGDIRTEFFARTGVALLDYDTAAAVAWAAENAGASEGPGIHKHLAYYWGLAEGRPAMDWAIALPESPAKSTILKRAFISFSRRHREDAEAWINEHPPHPLMRATYLQYLEARGKKDPESAFALAERAVEPELRNEMLAAAAQGWMSVDPQAASAWLATADLPAALAAKVRAAARPASEPSRG